MHFEIDRADFHHTRVISDHRPTDLPDGHVLLDVESFALTANNISYAVAGDALAYWDFFPVERPWGRIPVMGIGRVVASTTPGVKVGGRYFGFFPMADHHVVEAAANAEGFVDRGQHRAAHAPAYRSFNLVDNDPAYSRELEGHYLIARGLFITSFLVDDFLGDEGFFGAHSVIITSASSRTSLALAHRLRERGGMKVVGLTSASHTSFVAGTGLYDLVVDYDQLETIDATAPAVLVDMAGNANVISRVHHRFADQLKHSCRVGATHWTAGGSVANLPGPTPAFFFAPSHIKKRSAEWGRAEFEARVGRALADFLSHSQAWMHIRRSVGATALERVYRDTLDGAVHPDDGHILTLSTGTGVAVMADDIPVAYTPAGGWTEMPEPVLATCTEPLVEGAPDLRGTWKVIAVSAGGVDDPQHRAIGLVQRIEQAGNRLVVTAGRIVHDMRCDGTVENGVHDVAEIDVTTPITVVASYEDGVHVLRPVGLPIEVTRRRDGDHMVWTYVGFTAVLERID